MKAQLFSVNDKGEEELKEFATADECRLWLKLKLINVTTMAVVFRKQLKNMKPLSVGEAKRLIKQTKENYKVYDDGYTRVFKY